LNVLYVLDSDTLSGAEIVMLQCLEHIRPTHRAHVFLRKDNRRVQQVLEDRGIAYTTTTAYSRRLLETTASPTALLEFLRAFRAVRRELIELIVREKADLIHAVSYPASLYAALAARATGIRQIWHEHNIKRIHAVNRHLYRFVGSTCAAIVGPSEAVTRNLASVGLSPGLARTIYNGIDLSRFRIDDDRAMAVRRELGLSLGQPAVGLFGQMLPYKGHGTLIAAAPRLCASHPDARFYFVGALENPPYQAALEAQLTAAGLRDRFAFTGWRTDVPDVMRAMDVNVVATTTPEPAALALMETMAMGRPIVATRTGGTPEIVVDGETGLLFPAGDSATLGQHLLQLLADETLRSRLGREGRTRVEARFTLATHVEAMMALYGEALASPRSGMPAHTPR
jgi:glycosyltransferase involved in cell wall biosynthesis